MPDLIVLVVVVVSTLLGGFLREQRRLLVSVDVGKSWSAFVSFACWGVPRHDLLEGTLTTHIVLVQVRCRLLLITTLREFAAGLGRASSLFNLTIFALLIACERAPAKEAL